MHAVTRPEALAVVVIVSEVTLVPELDTLSDCAAVMVGELECVVLLEGVGVDDGERLVPDVRECVPESMALNDGKLE